MLFPQKGSEWFFYFWNQNLFGVQFILLITRWGFRHLLFSYSYRKKSNEIRSYEREDHPTQPHYPMIFRMNGLIKHFCTFSIWWNRRLSCWNHTCRKWSNGRLSKILADASFRSSKIGLPFTNPQKTKSLNQGCSWI